MWFSKPNAKVVKNLVLYNTYFVEIGRAHV